MVTVGGPLPCEVVGASQGEVLCLTPPSLLGDAGGSAEVRVLLVSGRNHSQEGLLGEYYFGSSSVDGSPQPDLARVDAEVNFQPSWSAFAGVAPQYVDNFAVRWTGYLLVEAGGAYALRLECGHDDDRMELWLDGAPVLASGRLTQGDAVATATTLLAAGAHYVNLTYGEVRGVASAILSYAGPDTGHAMVPVPARALVPPTGFAVHGAFAYGAAELAPTILEMEDDKLYII